MREKTLRGGQKLHWQGTKSIYGRNKKPQDVGYSWESSKQGGCS